MKRIFLILAALLTVTLATTSCTKDNEESDAQLDIKEVYDEMHDGVRLVLSYFPAKETFNGKIENHTIDTIQNIRIEIQLSNGTILGPSIPVDLLPKESKNVSLAAVGEVFVSWSPEVLTEAE